MSPTRDDSDARKLREVQQIFLDSVEGLAESAEQLVAAVNHGLEQVIDQLLRQACAEVGMDPEAFGRALEGDASLQQQLQQKLGALFTPEAVHRARGESQRRQAERHLHVLRFVLSGVEPPAWVWESMDPEEAARVKAFRRAGGDEDPEQLARVERALRKLGRGEGFGTCEACRRPISNERLGLIPWAERCTPCQLEAETPASAKAGARVPFWMFFERGKPVPKEKQLVI